MPFWLEMLEFSKPHDQFATRRKMYALAALALLGIRKNLPVAYDTLLRLAHHVKPQIRAQAISYLSDAYLEADRDIPETTIKELYGFATRTLIFCPGTKHA